MCCFEYVNYGIVDESGGFVVVIFYGVEGFQSVIELVGFYVVVDDV